ncbi:MAG: hypothetical protein R6T98_15475, partial [Desulfatiglandales bacterium]
MKNPAIFTILKKTMDFFKVTGGRVLSFRNVSVGEPAGPDLSGQCGGVLNIRKAGMDIQGHFHVSLFALAVVVFTFHHQLLMVVMGHHIHFMSY